MNGPRAGDCVTRSCTACGSFVGVLLPDEELELVDESVSLIPSISAGVVSCLRAAGLGALGVVVLAPLAGPGVNWMGGQL